MVLQQSLSLSKSCIKLTKYISIFTGTKMLLRQSSTLNRSRTTHKCIPNNYIHVSMKDIRKGYTTKETERENKWKDGAIEFSTSKAAAHSAEKAAAFIPENERQTNYPVLFTFVLVFIGFIYIGFIRDGERNDITEVDFSKFQAPPVEITKVKDTETEQSDSS